TTRGERACPWPTSSAGSRRTSTMSRTRRRRMFVRPGGHLRTKAPPRARSRSPPSRSPRSESDARCMKLELRYPATPDNAFDHAQLAVEAAWESGFELDYSPGSLETADAEIDALREEGNTGEDVAEALFVLGCYLGEVMVRALGGRWVTTPQSPLRDISPWPMVVILAGGSAWDAIGKVYKRLELGDSEYLPAYFAAAARGR